MSELKDYNIMDIEAMDDERLEKSESGKIQVTRVYIKSEADKVIAELKADYKEACDRLQTANLIKDEQIAATRHQKYKRCLAMAKWCRARYNEWAAYYPTTTTRKMKFLDKWEKHWLKIAEQFKDKEAK